MAQKKSRRTSRIISLLLIFSVILFFVLEIGLVSAASNDDFAQILQPLQTIYDLAKYAATVIAGLMMLFAGITYITSGADPGKREKAKNMIMYVIIGLMVIWAAPFVVKLILGS